MQSLFTVGMVLLFTVSLLLIVFAPGMKGRGFKTNLEKSEYKLEREKPQDDVERHRRRYYY